jgi:uncharacterized membrane protein
MPKSAASPLTTTGRILFALAILGFGIQYAIYGHLRFFLPLCPPWLPHNQLIAYTLAAFLAGAGIALLAAWRLQATALILALLLLLTSALYLQRLNYILHDGDGRTIFLECLCLSATALVLHGLSTGANAKLSLMPGRILFALAMIVFGAQHFMYTRFVATLVPAWIPQHVFWTIFTGLALIAAGISIATTIADKYAAYALFVLFFGWLVLLHAPRIFHALHNGDEWSSGFVVLALSGASLLLAASSTNT